MLVFLIYVCLTFIYNLVGTHVIFWKSEKLIFFFRYLTIKPTFYILVTKETNYYLIIDKGGSKKKRKMGIIIVTKQRKVLAAS